MNMPASSPLWPMRSMRRMLLQRIRSNRAAMATGLAYCRGATDEASLQLEVFDAMLRDHSRTTFARVVKASSENYRDYLALCRAKAPAPICAIAA